MGCVRTEAVEDRVVGFIYGSLTSTSPHVERTEQGRKRNLRTRKKTVPHSPSTERVQRLTGTASLSVHQSHPSTISNVRNDNPVKKVYRK